MMQKNIFCQIKKFATCFFICQQAILANAHLTNNISPDLNIKYFTVKSIDLDVFNKFLKKESKTLLQHGNKASRIVLDTIWVQDHIKNEQSFTENELDQIFTAIEILNSLITRNVPEYYLKWKANQLLGNNIDLSSPEHLIMISKKTIKTLSKIPEVESNVNLRTVFFKVLHELQNIPDEQTIEKQMITVSKSLETLLKNEHIKTIAEQRKIIKLIHKYVIGCIYAFAVDEFKLQLRKELTPLFSVGGNKLQMLFSLELGASLFYIINANISFLFNLGVAVKSHHEIEVTKAFSFSASTVAEAEKLVRTEIRGEGTVAAGCIFKNGDDFIDYHANDILPVLISSATNIKKNIKGIFKKRKSDSIYAQLQQNMRSLQELLVMINVITPEAKINIKPKRCIDYLDVKSQQCKAKLALFCGFGTLATDISAEKTVCRFHRYTDLLKTLKETPELLRKEPREYFSVCTDAGILNGEDAYQWLSSMWGYNHTLNRLIMEDMKCAGNDGVYMHAISNVRKIKNIERLLNVRNQFLQMVEYNAGYFNHYCALVNMYDKEKVASSKREIAKLKHNMEKQRELKGRANVIRSVITTNMALFNIYENSFTEYTPDLDKDKKMITLLEEQEQMYQSPPISLSTEQEKNNLMYSSFCTSKQLKKEHSLKVKLADLPFLLSYTISKETITDHYCCDTNGTYITLSIQGEAGVKVADFLDLLNNYCPFNIPEATGSVFFASSLPADMSFPLVDGSLRFEFQFIDLGKQACQEVFLQYIRCYRTESMGGDTPEIPVAPIPCGHIKIKLGLRLSNQRVIWERIGDNTLTYILGCYNGWVANSHEKSDIFDTVCKNRWQDFLSQHKNRLKKLLLNITDRDSNVSHEFNAILQRINDKKFSSLIWEALKNHKKEQSKESYIEVMRYFEDFLKLNKRFHVAEMQKRFSAEF